MKNLSAYKIKLLIIRPQQEGAVITMRDQKKLGTLFTVRRAHHMMIILPIDAQEKQAMLDRLKGLKLSKRMIATEITDAQHGRRHKLPENIKGTGYHATQKQLAESFTIG